MTQRSNVQPALDHLEAALEAICATLIALEAAGAGARKGAQDMRAVEAQIGDAIGSLREAIAELRKLDDIETSMLAFGFVLAADSGSSQDRIRRRAARGR